MYKILIVYFALSTLLSAYVKIEIGTASTYVPDSDHLTIDTTNGNSSHIYDSPESTLDFTFSKARDIFGDVSIGAVMHFTLDQRVEGLNRIFLFPALSASITSAFNILANAPEVFAYDYSYSPIITEFANSVLSITRSVTIKTSTPLLMQYGINNTLILKVSVKEDASSTYILTALYSAETAGNADVFFQNFSSSSQVTGGDSDGDGLTDSDEIFIFKTDPQRADSNDDGINDLDDRSLRLSNNLYTRVNDNASNYGLLSESEVTDLRPSSTLISVEDGNATLSLGIEQSSNLIDWVDTGETADANLSAPQGTRFFRFKVND